jgi:cysteinyl-tRNA synthetase
MAEEVLGVPFEVHGGGSDLVFPHHENEIAQTEAARGKPLSRTWMHNGMVQMGEEKMAKSVGNIRLLQGALDEFGRDAFVMWIVGAHYRKPVAYSQEALEEAARAVERVRDSVRRLDPDGAPAAELDAHAERFFDALADDFNTPIAQSVLFEWVADANRRIDAGEAVAAGRLGELLTALGLEGLLEQEDEAPAELQRLAAEREEARASRDFARADEIRDRLAGEGWEIRDTPEGARLVRAPPRERGSRGGG